MTPDKYTPFESKLETMLKGIQSHVTEIRGIVQGIYDRLTDIKQSSDAVYEAVTYDSHQDNNAASDDSDWDFLQDAEE